jgi:hypothetical protein
MKSAWSIATPLAVLVLGSGGSQLRAQDAEALARQGGCFACHSVDKPVVGPAFRDVAAKARVDARHFDLTLMSVTAAGDLPERRMATVVVAQVGRDTHIRIFDIDGMRLVDRRIDGLKEADRVARLNARIKAAATDGKTPSAGDRRAIIASAVEAAGLVVQDENGGRVESETRRFVVRK